MSDLFLTPDEVQELTHKTRYSAQIRALVQMGIKYRQRPDGSPAVLKDMLYDTGRTKIKEPHFSALKNA